MAITVVTSCSSAGWEKYGRRFVETFDKFWPTDIDLFVVSEDPILLPVGQRTTVQLDMNANPQAAEFMKRHAKNPVAHGLRKGANFVAIKDKHHGYNFKMDAFRFSKKVFAIKMVADLVPAGRLVWLDADVVTFEHVPHEFIMELPPTGLAIAYLGRKPYHSECGFVGYDLDHPATRPFIAKFFEIYTTDAVFKLKEWHDSFVFDHLRKVLGVPSYSIPHKSPSHPFVHSALGQYMDHLKGRRKDHGASREHPKFRKMG